MKAKTKLLFSMLMIISLTTTLFSQWANIPQRKIERYDASKHSNIPKLDVINQSSTQLQSQDGPRALIPIGTFTGTSGNGRAPQGSRLFINTKAIYSAAEMTASGFTGAVTSVQFNWDNTTAQAVATTGNLKIFLKDTSASATSFATATIDTTGTGATKVFDGTLTLPVIAGQFDINIPVGGPGTSTFTHTAGNAMILIFVYKTTTTLATPLASPTTACFVGATNSGATYQNQTTPGQSGGFTTFRPWISLGNALVDVVTAGPIYAMGKEAVCPCPDTNLVITNLFHLRAQLDTVIVTTLIKNVIGGGVKYSFTDTIITSAIERWLIFYVYPKESDIKKFDSIITTATIIGSEDVTGNNIAKYLKQSTLNAWNNAENNGITNGGVGVNGSAAELAAGFYVPCATQISKINLSFFAATGGGSQPYIVKVYNSSGDTMPGTALYTSGTLTSPAGVTGVAQKVDHMLPSLITVGPGYFYVGITQTGTTNLAMSFQIESPIRFGTYFGAVPPGSGWFDFAPGNDFRIDLGVEGPLKLNLGAYLEGFWDGSTMVADTMTVIAHNFNSPYAALDTAVAVVDNSGVGSFNFRKLNNDSCYFYEARHRNHITTWSHATCEKIDECDKLFDFRTDVSQAFGSNQKLEGGDVVIYGGEVNGDQFIDAGDIVDIYNAQGTFGYVVTDCNGDDFVDVSDLVIAYNNSNCACVGEVAP